MVGKIIIKAVLQGKQEFQQGLFGFYDDENEMA